MASTTQQANGALSQADLEAALRTRLIQSGEYSRIMELLRTRLTESNWNDQVRHLAREGARIPEGAGPDAKMVHLGQLVDQIEPKALELIPQEVKQEIEDLVHAFVKKSVE
ncbi:hypothetical protein JCM10212_004620 [Sporobolomyces blumeae]